VTIGTGFPINERNADGLLPSVNILFFTTSLELHTTATTSLKDEFRPHTSDVNEYILTHQYLSSCSASSIGPMNTKIGTQAGITYPRMKVNSGPHILKATLAQT
jgi:hypothetical protein